jgi:hypothetical protein
MLSGDNTEMRPAFWVRDVPVYGDTILSPMARYSDVPFRAVCRAHGSAMNYTEFVPAGALLREPNPMWRRLDVHPGGEKPMVFQIFGFDAQEMLAAARRIEAWGADIIDVNMGCAAPQVSEQGAGVGMMRRPELVAETFRLLTKHLRVPVTGKIRLGWDASSTQLSGDWPHHGGEWGGAGGGAWPHSGSKVQGRSGLGCDCPLKAGAEYSGDWQWGCENGR